ncbi:MAG: hypothetical protein M3Q64_02465, partial [bacterium]|nr:hypothetical protein [bacterium]
KRFFSTTILVAVFAAVLGSVFNPQSLIAKKVVLAVAEPLVTPQPTFTPHNCKDLEVTEGKNKIILQISDVQGYAWRDVVTTMVNDANNMQMPVVLSIIPQDVHADQELVEFVLNNRCRIEVAQQGSRIQTGESEFKGMTLDEMKDRAVEGKSILQWVLQTEVETIIPPYNFYNNQLLKAFDDVGYDAISIEGTLRKNQGIATFSYFRKRYLEPKQVVQMCKSAFNFNKNCVVILYPSQFEGENYANYANLLKALSEMKDVEFTTFKNVALEK